MSTQIGGSTTTPRGEPPGERLFPLWAQRALAIVGALALLGLLIAIGTQIAATQPSGTPVRVVPAQAGPYPLTVSLYKDPADAGYALPFAIAPARPVNGALRYSVLSLPHPGVDATPISGSVTPDPRVPNRATGTIEITVQGEWELNIVVDGPAGRGIANIPVTATAPPGLPGWIAWLIGLIPAIGLALFFAAQRRRAAERVPTGAA
jgi:hypothetical protein